MYISRTVQDIKEIPTVLSLGGSYRLSYTYTVKKTENRKNAIF